MKLKRYASKKVIAILMTTMLVIGGFFNQQRKINNLKQELFIQQNITDQMNSNTETQLDTHTLKEQLNKQCDFKVLDGTVNIKHTYEYERESILGLTSRYKLVGTADFYYELTVDLSEAEIVQATTEKITLEVPKAQVNESACHRVANSFIRLDDECSDNLLANKEDSEKATRQWEDTFDTKGVAYIKEYYEYDNMQGRTDNVTVHQIKTLLEELGYSQSLEIIVK